MLIFLGSAGNESTDGFTDFKNADTFAEAIKLAKANNVDEVYVYNTIEVTGTETWDGDGLTLTRASVMEESGGDMISVENGADLTLKNITINGSSQVGEKKTNSVKGSIINVKGTLTIGAGTTLQNNMKASNNNDYTDVGGAIYADGGTVNMIEGAIISGNCASFGGGIGLYHNATFNMYGGTISGNEAKGTTNAAGGGVMLAYDSVMNMYGGEINGNSSSYWGGGIALGANNDVLVKGGKTTLNLKGGSISGNTSKSNGGGIFVQANCTANIKAENGKKVYITGNTCNGGSFGGGGIYVNGVSSNSVPGIINGVVNLEKVEIANNSADTFGGAIAACPSSNVTIYLNNGAIIHDNDDDSTLYVTPSMQAGMNGIHRGSPIIILSDYMLGGGIYNWKNQVNKALEINEYGYHVLGGSQDWILSTDATVNGADANANTVKNGTALADVIISGNTSETMGGGIGSNGDIVIGTDSTALRVSKSVTGARKEFHKDDEFGFNLTFTSNPIGDQGDLKLYKNGKAVPGFAFDQTNGTWTYNFTLKDGDVILLTGLRPGVAYTLTEMDSKGADSVTMSYTPDTTPGMTNVT